MVKQLLKEHSNGAGQESRFEILNLLFQAEVTIESMGRGGDDEVPISALAYHLYKKKEFSKDSYRFETTSAVKLLIRQNASLQHFSAFSEGCRKYIDGADILKTLITYGKVTFAASLLDMFAEANIIVDVFKFAITSDLVEFTLLIFNKYSRILKEHTFYALNSVNASLEKSLNFFEAKLYLWSQLFPTCTYRNCDNFLRIMTEAVKDEALINSTVNSLKNIVLTIELVQESMDKFVNLRGRGNLILDRLIEMSHAYIDNIQKERELKILLNDKTLDDRKVSDIILGNGMTEVLTNDKMDFIINELWVSPYNVDGNLMANSSPYRILFVDAQHEESTRFYKERLTGKSIQHQFQFQVWYKSLRVRYYFEAFALLLITILLQVYVSLTLVEFHDFDTLNPTYLANKAI